MRSTSELEEGLTERLDDEEYVQFEDIIKQIDAAGLRDESMEIHDQAIMIEEDVMAMRVAGESYRAIQTELGISNAKRVFQRAMNRSGNIDYKRTEALRLEGERIDALQRSLWPRAMQGEIKAIEVCIRLLERRASLYGLNFSDMVSDKMADIEQNKVELMVAAFGHAMQQINLDEDTQKVVIDSFFSQLRQEDEPIEIEAQ